MDINTLVVASLQNNHDLEGRIWTIENAEKYSTLSEHRTELSQQVSAEILALMTDLNSQGISDEGVCAAPCGTGSLGDLLQSDRWRSGRSPGAGQRSLRRTGSRTSENIRPDGVFA